MRGGPASHIDQGRRSRFPARVLLRPGRGLLIPHGYLHPGKKANTAKCKVHQ